MYLLGLSGLGCVTIVDELVVCYTVYYHYYGYVICYPESASRVSTT